MAEWDDRLAIYDGMIAKVPGLRRKGKAAPSTTANGHMFSHLNKAGEIGLRLSETDARTFLAAYDSGPFLSYGAVMQGYVRVPESLHGDLDTLAEYLQRAHANVMAMDPPKSKKG